MVRSQASSLPGHIQAVYVHNIVKLAAHVLNKAVQENNTDVMEQVGYKNLYTSPKMVILNISYFHLLYTFSH